MNSSPENPFEHDIRYSTRIDDVCLKSSGVLDKYLFMNDLEPLGWYSAIQDTAYTTNSIHTEYTQIDDTHIPSKKVAF